MTKIQREIFKNEIYARHGYIFLNQLYVEFLKQYNWYQPMITKERFDYDILAQSERENIERLLTIE